MVSIKPMQDRVLVRRSEAKERTESGIVIPENAKEKPMEGEVLAVGKGKVQEDGTFLKVDVEVGDKVLFGKFSGQEVTVEGEELVLLREGDIYGVVG